MVFPSHFDSGNKSWLANTARTYLLWGDLNQIGHQIRNHIVLCKDVSPNYCNNQDFVPSKFVELCKKQYPKDWRAFQGWPPSRPSPKSTCGFGGRGMCCFYENRISCPSYCYAPPPIVLPAPLLFAGSIGGGQGGGRNARLTSWKFILRRPEPCPKSNSKLHRTM